MRSLQRDEVMLCYEQAEGDGPPILLVHGWCCNHSYLAPQFAHFARQGRHVVAVDLRGHGQSDKPSEPYTMQLFADDLAWICTRLGLAKPVVVGHSMGGIIAFELAVRHSDLPSAIVMLDSAVARPSESRAGIPRFLEALRGPDYRAALRSYVDSALFIPTDEPKRRAEILDDMSMAPQHVMISAFEGMRDYVPTAVAGGLRVPSLYIAADETLPRSDMTQLLALAPQLMHGRTVGSGHFCQLEVPDQVNAMIDRFLAVALPGA